MRVGMGCWPKSIFKKWSTYASVALSNLEDGTCFVREPGMAFGAVSSVQLEEIDTGGANESNPVEIKLSSLQQDFRICRG